MEPAPRSRKVQLTSGLRSVLQLSYADTTASRADATSSISCTATRLALGIAVLGRSPGTPWCAVQSAHGLGVIAAAAKVVALPNSETAARLRVCVLQAWRPGVLIRADMSCSLAGIPSKQRALDLGAACFHTFIAVATTRLQMVPCQLVCALLTQSRSCATPHPSRIIRSSAAARI
jgi:hypothetical protein